MRTLLMGKAKGIATAIDAMDSKQREGRPNRAFGEDYNTLRRLTGDQFPDLLPLLPPEVGPQDGWPDLCDTPYGDIRTYAEQIFQMLGTLDDA